MTLHRRWTVCLLSLALSLAGTLFSQPKSITILHTNDLHASFVPHEAFWVRQTPRPMVGGFQELFFTVDSLRKSKSPTLLLDAGDVMTGNPITERQYKGAYGGALFEMMNQIGYDVWCPGNHDFDVSQDNLAALTSIAKFPTVCANLVPEKGLEALHAEPYVVLERGGLRIGVIGIISQQLYGLVNQNNLVGIRVLSPAEELQKYIDELRSKTDLLIALTHEGFEEDSVLAWEVRDLNVIVGGHSHTRLKKPREVNGVIIVQAGSNCENLGELSLTVEGHRVVSFNGHLDQLWVRPDRPATPLGRFIDSTQAAIEKDYSEVIGTLGDEWVRGSGPNSMGEFIADAQREAAGADVGFMNDHGIRKDQAAGAITKMDLFEILPFRNLLTTFEVSGKELVDVVRYTLEKKPAIQVTGLSAEWKRGADGSIAIVKVEVAGRPLDEGKTYTCAASDYFVGEAKHYIGLEVIRPFYLRTTVFDAVEQAIRKAKLIRNSVPYRLTEVQ